MSRYSWNTARVTTSYLLKHAATLVEGKRILELGAGGALPSIACSLAGARTVVATDYADDVLMENIAFNATHNLGEGSSVLAVGHTWGHSVAELLDAGITDEDRKAAAPAAAAADDEQGRYDVVILSDLMFNHSQHGALVKTLEATLKTAVGVPTPDPQSPTAAPQTPCALVFLTHHRPWLADADMAFMPRLAKRGWGYERVVEEWTGPMFENDPGEERVRGTVHGFRVWRTGAAFEEDSDED